MQTQGSLAQTSLASLLEAMQSERATGTLQVRSGETGCSLFFLFGHLFHASGDLGQGEEAVIQALAWPDGSFTFDPRAKLPAEETIKAATGELLAEAERRRGPDGASNGSAPTETHAGEDAGAAAAPGEAPATEPAAEAGVEETAAPESTAGWAAVAELAPAAALEAPLDTASAVPSAAPDAASGETPIYGNPNAAPLGELYPLPSGRAVYEGLKSAFVDFPKLLRTLDQDGHTGYIRLDGPDFAGVLLLHEGRVLEALFSAGTLSQREPAFQELRARMERGEGLLDVIELPGETVVALAQLLTAQPLFTGLLARFVNFDALLEYLAEERINGSVVVAGGSETGVILLRDGQIHGAYTQSQRDLQQQGGAVSSLAGERSARIEVKAGSGAGTSIDVDAALRQPV